MDPEKQLQEMQAAADAFYAAAIKIGVHPWIEWTGLLNEYIKVCREAHRSGIDFANCNKHMGVLLPMRGHQLDYINEKLECIFSGQVMIRAEAQEA